MRRALGAVATVIAGVAVAACSSPREPSVPPPANFAPPGTPERTAPAGDSSMLDVVRDLSRFFATAPLTVDDVVVRLGPVDRDNGRHGSLELRAKDGRLTRVQLFRDAAGAPYLLSLDLAESGRPTLAALRAAFGPTRDMRTELGAAPEYMMQAPDTHQAFTVALIARLAEGAPRADTSPVVNVTLRRDERVE